MTLHQHGCSWCELTFKKLEHLQRHHHTLDRPYTCEYQTCSKTFARRDTLNRHARLHTRKLDPRAPVKGRRKRTKSTGGTDSTTPSTNAKAGQRGKSEEAEVPYSLTSPSSNYFNQTLPSILTRPNTSDGVGGNISEAYEAATVISRRHSFMDTSTSRSALPSMQAINHDRRSSAVANYGKNAYGMGESPGSDSSSEADDDKDEIYQNVVEVESQYPSPAFTSYSPAAPPMSLEAILSNDLHHTNHEIPHTIDDHSFEFDFINSLEGPAPKSVVAPYIDIPSPASSTALTHQQLSLFQQEQFSAQLEQLEKDREQIPTPRSNHLSTIPLQPNFFDDYNFSTQLFENSDRARRQQATQQALQEQLDLQQQIAQQRTLLHHQQHHAQQQQLQLQQKQLLALASLQSTQSKPHAPHSRSRSSTLPSIGVPYSSVSIAPNDLSNPSVPRSRSNTLNSIFPHIPLTPTIQSYPSPSLSAAYAASSFPSLLLQQHVPLKNSLGLETSPEQILYEAYQKRKSLAIPSTTASVASSTTSNGSSLDTINSSSTMDFFSLPTFENEKLTGIECGAVGGSWNEEEKREGINWLLL